MKKDTIRLFLLSGELADQLLWVELYPFISKMPETKDSFGNTEVIADEDGCFYARRFRFGGWTFNEKACSNCHTYQAVLKIAVQASVEEQVN